MGVIYKIVNIVNQKEYIGSAMKFNIRKSYHLTSLRKNKHHCIKLQRSFNKYGEENFIFYIIQDNIDKSELLSIEQKYLDSLNPELNTSKNAVSGVGRFKDKVCSFSLEGVFIKEFECAEEASEYYNCIPNKIRQVCNFDRDTHFNMCFRWKKYVDKNGLDFIKNEILNIKINRKTEKINQLDLENNFIKKWSSISEASKKLNLSYETIRMCCKGKKDTAGNYKWEYTEIKLKNEALKEINARALIKKENKKNHKYLNRKGSIPIIAINLKNKCVYEFPSMMEAQRKINVSQSNIWKVLKGQISKCNGYRFENKKEIKHENIN